MSDFEYILMEKKTWEWTRTAVCSSLLNTKNKWEDTSIGVYLKYPTGDQNITEAKFKFNTKVKFSFRWNSGTSFKSFWPQLLIISTLWRCTEVTRFGSSWRNWMTSRCILDEIIILLLSHVTLAVCEISIYFAKTKNNTNTKKLLTSIN